MDYKHIYCKRGGTIGMWDSRKGFMCEKCKKRISFTQIRL